MKAGGYGHGAAEVAAAALAGGATWLAVALVEEGRELRAAGITAPVLLLSEPPSDAMAEVVAAGITPTLPPPVGGAARRGAAARGGPAGAGRPPVAVHVKVDTGMHRVGATPDAAVRLAAEVAAQPALDLEGFWTHLAVSDEVGNPYNAAQFDLYEATLAELAAAGVRPAVRHASNSGGTIWHARGHYDMVRCGIGLYGLSPAPPPPTPAAPWPPDGFGTEVAAPALPVELRPAMSLKARVSYAKVVTAGERLSYGLRYQLAEDSVVATVPLGYADGIPRRLAAAGGEVLIGGRRCRLAGTVTMDQVLVDCGPRASVAAGDEVVLIGRQGGQIIDAWEWAVRIGTIAYEVVCGISGRVPRLYIDGSWQRGAG